MNLCLLLILLNFEVLSLFIFLLPIDSFLNFIHTLVSVVISFLCSGFGLLVVVVPDLFLFGSTLVSITVYMSGF